MLWPRPEVEITEEMVERAARTIYVQRWEHDWERADPGVAKCCRVEARAALEAALGGNDE